LKLCTVKDFHKLDNVWKKVFKTSSKETISDLRQAVCQFYVKNQNLNFYETLTPLHVAAGAGHELLFKTVFKKAKDKYPKDEKGQTPLFYAAQNGHLDICSFIMARIEEKNHRQNDGSTPFHSAAYNGHLNICKY
jgi:ankyrin repeat protein